MRERVRKEKYYRQEEHNPELYRNILNSKKDGSTAISILQYETVIVLDSPKMKSNQDSLASKHLSTHKCRCYIDVMTLNSSTAIFMQPEQPS